MDEQTGPPSRRRVVFVDRDGTLNPDLRYLKDAARVELYAGVPEGIRRLREHGYRLVCVTNQSGIGRGWYTAADVDRIHDRIQEKLRFSGAQIDAFYYCPHAPDAGCDCRKPGTRLFREAATEHHLSLAGGAIIGDRSLDMAAGESLGLLTVQVVPPGHVEEAERERRESRVEPDLIARSFLGAALRILALG